MDTNEADIFFWVLVLALPLLGWGLSKVDESPVRIALMLLILGAFAGVGITKNQDKGIFLTVEGLPADSRWERAEKPSAFEIRNLDTGERKFLKSDTELKRFQVSAEWGWPWNEGDYLPSLPGRSFTLVPLDE